MLAGRGQCDECICVKISFVLLNYLVIEEFQEWGGFFLLKKKEKKKGNICEELIRVFRLFSYYQVSKYVCKVSNKQFTPA